MVAVIISICASIISGMVLFFLQSYFKKKQKEDEKENIKDIGKMFSLLRVLAQ